MALTWESMAVVDQIIRSRSEAVGGSPLKICSLGYPDFLCSRRALATLFEVDEEKLHTRSDSAGIAAWHGRDPAQDVVDAYNLFGILGHELTVFDIGEFRGGECIQDLNYSLPEEFSESYDVVIDGGTLEHCFNIAQAIINVLSMVKIGGSVFHLQPFSMANHGFYNLNPTWYFDFYENNGGRVELLKVVTQKAGEKGRFMDVPFTKRFSGVGEEAQIMAVATRVQRVEFQFPVQSKYRAN